MKNRIKDFIFLIKDFAKWYLNPYFWIKPYFVSFIEEGIFNPTYKEYVGGRVEIWSQWSQYDIDEWRFLTKDIGEFYKIRNRYDLKNFSRQGLRRFKRIIEKYNFHLLDD
ncbi:MAG: hypothetical protein NTX26_00205 [Candidatus Parcubacteria bacterium]|nr:hypothetical protein [Candidatus Parcubacteria bacterium]